MRIDRALLATAALVAATPDVVEAACIPGFDYAAFGKNSVTFGGGAKTNSYNSATGTYASTNALSNGNAILAPPGPARGRGHVGRVGADGHAQMV